MIPFTEDNARAVRAGWKTVTSRPKRYGKPGDVIMAQRVGPILLLEVRRLPLGHVAHYLWRQEGCASEYDFIQVWRSLHPRSGFDPVRRVWVHRFEVVKTESPR